MQIRHKAAPTFVPLGADSASHQRPSPPFSTNCVALSIAVLHLGSSIGRGREKLKKKNKIKNNTIHLQAGI